MADGVCDRGGRDLRLCTTGVCRCGCRWARCHVRAVRVPVRWPVRRGCGSARPGRVSWACSGSARPAPRNPSCPLFSPPAFQFPRALARPFPGLWPARPPDLLCVPQQWPWGSGHGAVGFGKTMSRNIRQKGVDSGVENGWRRSPCPAEPWPVTNSRARPVVRRSRQAVSAGGLVGRAGPAGLHLRLRVGAALLSPLIGAGGSSGLRGAAVRTPARPGSGCYC